MPNPTETKLPSDKLAITTISIDEKPTILLLDQKGTLRAINARNSYESWIRKLLMERN